MTTALEYKADAVRIRINEALAAWEQSARDRDDPLSNFRAITQLAYLLTQVAADARTTADLAQMYLIGKGLASERDLASVRRVTAADITAWYQNLNGRTQALLSTEILGGNEDEPYGKWASDEPTLPRIKIDEEDYH